MRLSKLFLFLPLAASLQLSAQSKYEWKESSSGGYTYRYVTGDPIAGAHYTLKNGLTVILSVNKKETPHPDADRRPRGQ